MITKTTTKLIHEGDHIVAVMVELIVTDDGWSPYLTPEDAYRLDKARAALRAGDLAAAARFGQVYKLTPVAH